MITKNYFLKMETKPLTALLRPFSLPKTIEKLIKAYVYCIVTPVEPGSVFEFVGCMDTEYAVLVTGLEYSDLHSDYLNVWCTISSNVWSNASQYGDFDWTDDEPEEDTEEMLLPICITELTEWGWIEIPELEKIRGNRVWCSKVANFVSKKED